MLTRCVAFSPFDPRTGKRFPPPLSLQAQAAGNLDLNSTQLRAILEIVSRLADSKTKQETVSRLADNKTKQLAAASAEAPAPTEEGFFSAGCFVLSSEVPSRPETEDETEPSEVDSPEGSISGEGSAAAMPPSLRSLRVGILAVRAAAPRGADN